MNFTPSKNNEHLSKSKQSHNIKTLYETNNFPISIMCISYESKYPIYVSYGQGYGRCGACVLFLFHFTPSCFKNTTLIRLANENRRTFITENN